MTTLRKIKSDKSMFGPSFGGKAKTQFFHIINAKKVAGEVEYDVDNNEILSIYVDNDFRGLGLGKIAVNLLFEQFDTDKIYAWSAKSSLPFWKKVATKEVSKDHFIIEKSK